jgi:hypothetical protein
MSTRALYICVPVSRRPEQRLCRVRPARRPTPNGAHQTGASPFPSRAHQTGQTDARSTPTPAPSHEPARRLLDAPPDREPINRPIATSQTQTAAGSLDARSTGYQRAPTRTRARPLDARRNRARHPTGPTGPTTASRPHDQRKPSRLRPKTCHEQRKQASKLNNLRSQLLAQPVGRFARRRIVAGQSRCRQ